jgi:predicted KAP-like P-loop ATPase
LKNSNYSVYALAGDWGSGKTTFIKLWEKSLISIDYIHIDVFEMDYETEPFIMLIKHFYKYLKTKNKIDKKSMDDFLKKAKQVFMRSLKTIGVAGANIIANKFIGNENVKNIIHDFSEIIFDELVLSESEKTSLYEKLKEVLNKIVGKLETPLYIIVDELDRCRPSFALETLEKIKHIFCVKNLKFILVYNPYILESIVEKTYGVTNGV